MFPVNHMTTLKDWENFLNTTLKITRLNPKKLNIKFDKTLKPEKKKRRKEAFEQAMWDKFLCETYYDYITSTLYKDESVSIPPLYTVENTGLKTMLNTKNKPRIITPSSKDIININKKKFSNKETLH